MDIVITSQNKTEYLLIESKGHLLSKEDLFNHSHMIYEEIIKHAVEKILIYEPETHFPAGLSSYLDLVHHYINNFPPEIRNLRIAVVTSHEYKEIAGFWETACVNRGYRYFAFTSFQDAHDWLIN